MKTVQPNGALIVEPHTSYAPETMLFVHKATFHIEQKKPQTVEKKSVGSDTSYKFLFKQLFKKTHQALYTHILNRPNDNSEVTGWFHARRQQGRQPGLARWETLTIHVKLIEGEIPKSMLFTWWAHKQHTSVNSSKGGNSSYNSLS